MKWFATATVLSVPATALAVFASASVALAGGTGADLHVSGSAARPNAGEPFSYTFQVRNSGPDVATSTVFTDVLPAGTVYNYARVNFFSVPCSAADGVGGVVVTCNLGLITKGGQATVIVNVKAPVTAGTFSNTGTATASVSDPLPANNSAAVTSQVTIATSALPAGETTMNGLAMLKYTGSFGLFENFLFQANNGVLYTVITNFYDGSAPLTHVINLDCKQTIVQFVGVGDFVNVTGTVGPPMQYGSFFTPVLYASVVQVLTHKDKP